MTTVPQSMEYRSWLRHVLVGSILLLHALLVWHSSRQNFITIDEVGALTAGVSHWETGNFILYRVNPPLPRLAATLPVWLSKPDTSYERSPDRPGARPEWEVGPQFALKNADRYLTLIRLSRLAGILWSVLGGWLVWRWAGELYGPRGAWLSLLLWCVSPTVLAHAPLLTPDLPATVAGLAATYAFWRYLRRPSWLAAAAAGLLLGVAQLSKFTLLLLYVVWPLLWLAYRWARRADPSAVQPGWRVEAAQGCLVGLLSWLVLLWGYSFTGTFQPLSSFAFVSRPFAGEPPPGHRVFDGGEFGNRFYDSWLASCPVPVPADYLYGIDLQARDFEKGWWSYLRGEWREGGWWHYYLYALAVKVPLGAWALVLAGLGLTLLRHRASAPWPDELVLWLTALAILAFVSSQTGFSHHMRYVMPLFPFAIIATGKLGYFWQAPHWKAALVVAALLVWDAGSSLRVYPHSLSYFNELAGGPKHGQEHLLNSNIDWGQDLLYLRAWLDEHPEARPLKLAYYNHVDPKVIGLKFQLPPLGPVGKKIPNTETLAQQGPQSGYYAISVNYVYGSGFIAPDGKGRFAGVPLHGYEYFRHFEPIATAGYSIYIYHITPEQADNVRQQLGLPPILGRANNVLEASE